MVLIIPMVDLLCLIIMMSVETMLNEATQRIISSTINIIFFVNSRDLKKLGFCFDQSLTKKPPLASNAISLISYLAISGLLNSSPFNELYSKYNYKKYIEISGGSKMKTKKRKYKTKKIKYNTKKKNITLKKRKYNTKKKKYNT